MWAKEMWAKALEIEWEKDQVDERGAKLDPWRKAWGEELHAVEPDPWLVDDGEQLEHEPDAEQPSEELDRGDGDGQLQHEPDPEQLGKELEPSDDEEHLDHETDEERLGDEELEHEPGDDEEQLEHEPDEEGLGDGVDEGMEPGEESGNEPCEEVEEGADDEFEESTYHSLFGEEMSEPDSDFVFFVSRLQ